MLAMPIVARARAISELRDSEINLLDAHKIGALVLIFASEHLTIKRAS